LKKLEIPSTQGKYVPSLIDFGELFLEKILKNFQCIFTFLHLSPFGKGNPLPLNKLESPPSMDNLYQVSLKLAQWFWRRRFLNDPTPFLHVCDYLSSEEDLALHLNKLKFPSPKDNLYKV
jgi:hypothetical protein